MPTIALSEAARALLRIHLSGGSLQVGAINPDSLPGLTLEQTRAAYRELADAGLVEPLHSFAHGRDARYRLTKADAESSAALPA
jgi:hypothetical protein